MKKYRGLPTTPVKPFCTLKRQVNSLFMKKHKTDPDTYNNKAVNDIIFNEKSRLVALFKDFLILDDASEFLRRFYNSKESHTRLTKIVNFYEAYSKIFPNYIIIPESKYLYKNIRRKQKMIDAFNQIKMEEEENRKSCGLNNLVQKKKKPNKFFDTEIRQSILRYQPGHCFHNTSIDKNSNKSLQSIDKIYNVNVSASLNLNRNIYEGEESVLSVQNILNEMEKKEAKVDSLEEQKKKLKTVIEENKGKIHPNSLTGKFVRLGSKKKSTKKLDVIVVDNNNAACSAIGEEMNKDKKVENQNANQNPVIKKLSLKKLSLKCANSPVPKIINTESIEKTTASSLIPSPKRVITHRISSSIPDDIYKTSKNIKKEANNTASNSNNRTFIIPGDNTHISINNNFYNCGTNQQQLVTIEQYSTNPKDFMIETCPKSKNDKNFEEKCIVSPKELSSKFKKFNYNKENCISPKISQVFNSNNTYKSNIKQSIKMSSTESTNNTNGNAETKASSQQSQQKYSKVLKMFNDNIKSSSAVGTFHTVGKERKLLIKRNDRNYQTLRVDSTNDKEAIDHCNNTNNTKYDTIETEKGVKSRLEMREAYKKFLEQNKLECLTARNSLEKVSNTYKILNGDFTNTLNIASNKGGSIFQSREVTGKGSDNNINKGVSKVDTKNYKYKKNIHLSPIYTEEQPISPYSLRKGQSDLKSIYHTSSQTITTPLKKPANKVKTPVKYSSKAKIVYTETTEKAIQPQSKTTRKENLNLKVNFSPDLQGIMTNNCNINPKNTKKQLNQKYAAMRGVVKSLDFQALKSLKK